MQRIIIILILMINVTQANNAMCQIYLTQLSEDFAELELKKTCYAFEQYYKTTYKVASNGCFKMSSEQFEKKMDKLLKIYNKECNK